MHLAGGCFYYSNKLIEHFSNADVYIPSKVLEEGSIPNAKTLKFYGYPSIIRYLSLALFLVKIIVLGRIGYYNALFLAGYTSWDYYIMKAWRLTGRKSFFVVHDGKLHSGEDDKCLQRKLNYIMQNASNLIFLSNYVRTDVINNYNIDKPYHIAPHGLIDYGGIPSNSCSFPPSVLFLGRVSYYKGIDILLKAIDLIPEKMYSEIIIAGKWNESASKSTNPKIKFVDKWLSVDEMREFLLHADIMVFPYREASQSGVITLAINYAIPFVYTDVGALHEQAPQGGSVSVAEVTPNAIADGLMNLLTDKDRLLSMKRILMKAKETYSWEKIAKDCQSYIHSELS